MDGRESDASALVDGHLREMISSSSLNSERRRVCSRETIPDEERARTWTPNVPKYSRNLCPWSKLGKAGTEPGQNPGDAPGVALERFLGGQWREEERKLQNFVAVRKCPCLGTGLALLEQRSDSSDPISTLCCFVGAQSIKRSTGWGLLPVELTPYPTISLAGSAADQVRGLALFLTPLCPWPAHGQGQPWPQRGPRGLSGTGLGTSGLLSSSNPETGPV